MTTTDRPVSYRPGDTFTCTARAFDPDAPDGLGEACGASIVMHGYHWCDQVCPACLRCYRVTGDNRVTLAHGWFTGDTRTAVLANIASNGGQYVPTFR